MKIRSAAVVVALCLLLVGSCAPSESVETKSDDIKRWHDDKYKVTCWVYSGIGFAGRPAAGISCLPDSLLEELDE